MKGSILSIDTSEKMIKYLQNDWQNINYNNKLFVKLSRINNVETLDLELTD